MLSGSFLLLLLWHAPSWHPLPWQETATPAATATPPAQPPACERSDVLVTVRGEKIDTRKNGYRLDGGRYLYRNSTGALVALRASEVDLQATRREHEARCAAERALVRSVLDQVKAKSANPLERAAQHDARPPAMVLKLEGGGDDFLTMMARLGVDRGLLDTIAKDPTAQERLAIEVVAFMMDLASSAQGQSGFDSSSGAPAMRNRLYAAAHLARSRASLVADQRVRSALRQVAAKLDALAEKAATSPEAVAAELRAIID